MIVGRKPLGDHVGRPAAVGDGVARSRRGGCRCRRPAWPIERPAMCMVPPGRKFRSPCRRRRRATCKYWSQSGLMRPQRCSKAAIWSAVTLGFCANRSAGLPGAGASGRTVTMVITIRTGMAWMQPSDRVLDHPARSCMREGDEPDRARRPLCCTTQSTDHLKADGRGSATGDHQSPMFHSPPPVPGLPVKFCILGATSHTSLR